MADLPSRECLYEANSPAMFWRLIARPGPTKAEWSEAISAATKELPFTALTEGVETVSLLAQTLGEGQFGESHWTLSPVKRMYYWLKPLVPRKVTRIMREVYRTASETDFLLRWPIEDRFARFHWEVMRQLLELTGAETLPFVHFWPHGRRFALVLTHDIETADGQSKVRRVADLEEGLGFRSSFNFVPERYRIDQELIQELEARGFEIGVHGLKHDGKLFHSETEFRRRAERINGYLREFGAVGFRAPLTHRNPEWMQVLDIEYDLSFFDTDPYEPLPGGTMSIWPFIMGRFVELPYTLVQDYTLTAVLREATPQLWLDKLAFIRSYFGMALLNSHPDYLPMAKAWRVYVEFLEGVKAMGDYWNGLPREVARWWRDRASVERLDSLPGAVLSELRLTGEDLAIEPQLRTRTTEGEEGMVVNGNK